MEGYTKIGQYPFNGKAAEFIVTEIEGCARDALYMELAYLSKLPEENAIPINLKHF